MTRRTISSAATETLEAWLDQVQRGQLSLGELPLAIEAWLSAGHAMGVQSRDDEVRALERQVNYLHYLAFTPERERIAELEARLAYSLDQADERVWTQIEQDLRAMRGTNQKEDSLERIAGDHESQIGQQNEQSRNQHGRAA